MTGPRWIPRFVPPPVPDLRLPADEPGTGAAAAPLVVTPEPVVPVADARRPAFPRPQLGPHAVGAA